MKRNFSKILLSLLLVLSFLPINNISLANTSDVVINEIESSAPNKGKDWVEIYNKGKQPVDISGWFLTDDGELGRLDNNETTPFPEGTILEPGKFIVLKEGSEFTFGIGKEDAVILYDYNKSLVDNFSWASHAQGTYSRYPDGIGEFVDMDATEGLPNSKKEEETKPSVLINEINSAPDDWVEFVLTEGESIDISGYEIRDNSDDHRWKFPEGTILNKSDYLVVDAKTQGLIYDDKAKEYVPGSFEEAIGIGSGDSIRFYDRDENLLDSHSWTEHAAYEGDESKASLGRYEDGKGNFILMPETKGMTNSWYKPEVVINEIESNGDTTDWVEILNIGTTPVDISGWKILDNDPSHLKDSRGLDANTILKPGEYFVFEENTHFNFGLGKNDEVNLLIASDAVVETYKWTGHAAGVLARIPDGTGEFIDFDTPTKNAPNLKTNPVVLNEIQSNDPNKGPDWIELANPTDSKLDISGLIIKDNDDSHEYTIPEGTVIEANGFLVLTDEDFGFGLGKSDMVRIYQGNLLIQSAKWEGHTNPTWGLYPDVNGMEYRNTLVETKGSANKFPGIPEKYDALETCPVVVLDKTKTFLEDSSGLDFHDGKLYAVDNGTGIFWIVELGEDNSINVLSQKRVRFKKDAENPDAKGPDTEGIAVDGRGMVYVASERDNSNKGVNYNTILMVDPGAKEKDLVSIKEWDITSLLPQVSANTGIEAIEWIPRNHIENMVVDMNTKELLDLNNYPNAVGDGIFTVALEDNGHVYGFVLNEDETANMVFDIDSKLGGAMSLNYDDEERLLWISADDGFNNMRAVLEFDKTESGKISHVNPPKDLPVNNFEGFAIGESDKDGVRKVLWFEDGVASGALRMSCIVGSYRERLGFDKLESPEKPNPPKPNPDKPTPSVPVTPPVEDDSDNIKVESFGDIYRSFEIERIFGKDRYETAVAISKKYFESSDTVILASGREFVDALTVSPLASLEKAPILLTRNSEIPKATLEEIIRLKAKNIIIAGGRSTVSKEVEDELKGVGYDLTRLYGKDRYETAIRIGEEIRKKSGNQNEVVLTSGVELVDALTGNNIAGKRDIPILLTQKDRLNSKTSEALNMWNIKTSIIVGGRSSVGEGVKDDLEGLGIDTLRLFGKDRYETAIKVADYSYPNSKEIFLASGTNYIDALVGGAVTKRANSPLLLVKYDELPASLKDYLNSNEVDKITLLGGSSSIKTK
ncbi:lamin tail domain-containing protein [Lagierella sp.]|uniref:lamin tail domain-containing protein n=1 Tax=Lagierella sp. TaxID=2849657 RepID=UPI002626EE06|nr:lamin tail domain-containing protein [Lagierella sp.]